MALDNQGGGARNRRPSNRGISYSRVSRGVEIQQRWPRSRGKNIHPKTKAQMEFFRQVQWAFKFSDPSIQVSFSQAVHRTPLMPRDLFLMAISGRMHSLTDPTGRTFFSMAAVRNVSDSLDVVAQSPGDMLTRGHEVWGPTPRDPGNGGLVFASPFNIQAPNETDDCLLELIAGDGTVRSRFIRTASAGDGLGLDGPNFYWFNAATGDFFAYADKDGVYFYCESTPRIWTSTTGVEINGYADASGGYYVLGTKVLGPRQPHIAHDGSGSPNSATVNAIIACLEAMGISAP